MTIKSIENQAGYYVLIIFSMLYMSIMICNAILTNRYIGINEFFILGGTLTSPFIFILDNIVTEIYGYRMTQCMIFSGFGSLTVFTLICQFAVSVPHPEFFKEEHAYLYILGPSLLRIEISGFIAYIVANLFNSFILSRWKILIKGRKFWLRNLGASTFSEAMYSLLAILMMEIQAIPLHNIFQVIFVSYLIKIFFTSLFAFPSQILVNYLKKLTGIDVYDFKKEFTPSKFSDGYGRG